MLAALGLCLVSAIQVQIEATTGVSEDLSRELSSQLATAIEAQTRQHTEVAASVSPDSTSIGLLIDGGATQIQIKATRTEGGRRVKEQIVRGPFAAEGWEEPLRELARGLFPELPTTAAAPARADEDEGTNWLPIALLGASVACVASSAGFAISSRGAHSELTENLIVGDEAAALSDRASTHGAIGAGFAAAALVAAGTSVLLLLE